jgi:hypothetical protein
MGLLPGVTGGGEAIFELDVVATDPGGRGSFVLALADPGRIMGLESEMLGLSAYPLCSWHNVSTQCSQLAFREVWKARTIPTDTGRIACHCDPALATLGL